MTEIVSAARPRERRLGGVVVHHILHLKPEVVHLALRCVQLGCEIGNFLLGLLRPVLQGSASMLGHLQLGAHQSVLTLAALLDNGGDSANIDVSLVRASCSDRLQMCGPRQQLRVLTRQLSCLHGVPLLELFVMISGLPMNCRLLVSDCVMFTEGSALSGAECQAHAPALACAQKP